MESIAEMCENLRMFINAVYYFKMAVACLIVLIVLVWLLSKIFDYVAKNYHLKNWWENKKWRG